MPATERPIPLGRLKTRAEYLRVRNGRSRRSGTLVLQAHRRAHTEEHEAGTARFGFTATKMIGNAVTRNRARRRLKETVRLVAGARARPGYDYVVIARQGAVTQSFGTMQQDLLHALAEIHEQQPARASRTVRPTRN